ncbi:MAG: sensor histidine kinase [Natronospirillum sp.]
MRSLWHEPALPPPVIPRWRHWLLVLGLALVAVAEGIWRPDLEWRLVPTVVTVVLLFGLFWRHSHPMLTLLITFESLQLLDWVARANGIVSDGMMTQVYVLILPYALVRRASGSHIILGLGIAVVSYAFWHASDWGNLAEHVAGLLVFLIPALIGAVVRFRERAAVQQLEQFKMRERTQLAREIHDSVAHYVSAIAVQAQAGLAVAHQQPDAALAALTTIETTSRQALSELRSVVRALRHDGQPDWAPQPQVSDIARLAEDDASAHKVPVSVSYSGDVDDVSPAVSAALYRLAQESITNAQRHARDASKIVVTLTGTTQSVRLQITDDGTARSLADSFKSGTGYGLVGMAERASLLGGTFHAGWRTEGGWQVTVELPRYEDQG